MKFYAIIAVLFASVAHADTVTLASTAGSGHLQEFLNVPNDAGLDIDVYPGEVIIDGVAYLLKGGTYQSADGAVITFSADLTGARVCVKAGRGQTCYTRWTLASGTIVR